MPKRFQISRSLLEEDLETKLLSILPILPRTTVAEGMAIRAGGAIFIKSAIVSNMALALLMC